MARVAHSSVTGDDDPAAGGREFEGVIEEVGEDLADARGVGGDEHRRGEVFFERRCSFSAET